MSAEVQDARKERAEFVMLEIANRSGKVRERTVEEEEKYKAILAELNEALFG